MNEWQLQLQFQLQLQLQLQLQFQRQLRLSDAKAVEAKAARIKDWVTNKLRELEEQNAHLKLQNAKASDQVKYMTVLYKIIIISVFYETI